MSEIKKYLKVRHVMKKFSISRPTVYRWVENGILPKPIKLGSESFWDEDELNEMMKKGKVA